MNIVNISGKLCIKTKEYGYVTLHEYSLLKSINPEYQTDESKISVDCMLIQNRHDKLLTKEEVLDVFVQYIHKYRNDYKIFDIPVGTKYLNHSKYIHAQLKHAFPNIHWKCLWINESTCLCRGEMV